MNEIKDGVRQHKGALLFITYNRPVHFERVMSAAEESHGFEKLLKIVVQQGSNRNISNFIAKREYDVCLLKTQFLQKTSSRARINYNMHLGVMTAFEQFDCDFIIVLEDDIVVSPYFFTFVESVMKEHLQNVKFRAVNGFSQNLFSSDQVIDKFGYIRLNYGVGWGWAMPRRTYFALKNSWTGMEDDHWDSLIEPYFRTGYVINPSLSFISNIGLEGSGAHSGTNLELERLIELSFKENLKRFALGFNEIIEAPQQFIWRNDCYSVSLMGHFQEKFIYAIWGLWWTLWGRRGASVSKVTPSTRTLLAIRGVSLKALRIITRGVLKKFAV